MNYKETAKTKIIFICQEQFYVYLGFEVVDEEEKRTITISYSGNMTTNQLFLTEDKLGSYPQVGTGDFIPELYLDN